MVSCVCYNCDEEFTVEPVFITTQEVSFCPYCGSEIEPSEWVEDDTESLDDEDEDPRH
jgi:rRNA maturation endonuclease Nob1